MADFNLQDWIDSNGIPAPAGFVDKMSRLLELLTEVNSTHNLTRIVSEQDFWIKHVADSIAILQFFPELAKADISLLDIGCGAGFPSVPLAAACPNMRITAMDSIGKKTSFVRLAADDLGLDNLQVVTARARELNRKEEWRNRFDLITARAVAPARMLYRETRAMRSENGRFIFYKTPEQIVEDLPQVSKDSASHGLTWTTSDIFELPEKSGMRQFLYSSETE